MRGIKRALVLALLGTATLRAETSNAPSISVNAIGSTVTLSWTLPTGSWSSPAVDSSKTCRLIIDDGGAEERSVDVYLAKLVSGPTVSTTTNANDTVSITALFNGDAMGFPEHNQVYDDEIVDVVTVAAGIVTDAQDTSAAGSGGVPNNSTATWPRIVFGWTMDPAVPNTAPFSLVTSTSYNLYFFAWGKYGINLAGSTVRITDSAAGTADATLSLVTMSHDGSYVTIGQQYSVYRAAFDLTGRADGAATVRATIVPAFGPSDSSTQYVTGGAGDWADFACTLDLDSSVTTSTAWVDDSYSLAVTGITGGAFTPGNAIVAGTTGVRGVIDLDSNTSSSPLRIVYITGVNSTGFHSSGAETITEWAIGKSLVVSSGAAGVQRKWIQSGADADEYYLANGSDAPIDVSAWGSITLNERSQGVSWSEGSAVGSLTDRQWKAGDNDSLGVTALYINPATVPVAIASWPENYLRADYTTGVTATTDGVPTSNADATPALDDAGQPYASVNAAARAIADAHSNETGSSTIYLVRGYHTIGTKHDGSSGSGKAENTRLVAVTRAPGTTQDEVIGTQNSTSSALPQYLRNLHVHDLTFEVTWPNLDEFLNWGQNDDPYLLFRNLIIIGKGGSRAATNFTSNQDLLFAANIRCRDYRSGLTVPANSYGSVINWHHDGDSDVIVLGLGQGNVLLINLESVGMDGIELGNHPDFFQTTDVAVNAIFYNARQLAARYQTLFFGLPSAKGMTVINGIFEMVDDGDTGSGASFGSTGNYNEFYLLNCTFARKDGSQAITANTATGSNNSIRNCVFAPSSNIKGFWLPVNCHQSNTGINDGEFGVRASSGGSLATLFTTGAPTNLTAWPVASSWTGTDIWRPAVAGTLDNHLETRDLIQGVAYDIYGTAWSAGGSIGGAMAEAGANTPPVVTILFPPGNPHYATTAQTVMFAAIATDAEDGTISGDIDWSSDLDGSLGTGASIAVQLSAGTHTITATIEDSGTEEGTDTRTVVVTDKPPYVRERTRLPRR